MKKVINGRRYDTGTAALVARWDNGLGEEPDVLEETSLYRKRSGEYFLAEEGGAMTRFARRVGTAWEPGWAITPLSYDEAREAAELGMDGDAYEAEFGPVPEGDEETAQVSVHLTGAARARLARAASETGETRSAIVERLIMGM